MLATRLRQGGGPGAPRINIWTNPSFETNATGWDGKPASWGGGAGTIALSPGTGRDGGQCWRKTWTTAGSSVDTGFKAIGVPVSPGLPYSLSAYLRSSITNRGDARLQWFDGGHASLGFVSGTGGSGTVMVAGTWLLLSITNTIAPAGAATVEPYITPYSGGAATAAGDYIEIDQLIVEQSAVLGAYFDGSTPSDATNTYAWSGTAHASTSIATPI